MLAVDIPHFCQKFVNVFELAIDGRKPDIRHVIKLFQAVHHKLADFRAKDFSAIRRANVHFNPARKAFDGVHRNRPLFAGRHDAVSKLFLLKRLAPVIFLHDIERRLLNRLVCREFVAAFEAFPAAADNAAALRVSGIYDFIVIFSANRATHSGI